MTVEKLADIVKIPTDKVMANLQQHGIQVSSPQVTVKQLADDHQLSPQQIYQRIQSEDAKPSVNLVEGGGWGRLNVQQVCERFSVTVDTGLRRLTDAGITAGRDMMIRELATAQRKTPIEITKIIVGQNGTVPAPGVHRPDGSRDIRSGK